MNKVKSILITGSPKAICKSILHQLIDYNVRILVNPIEIQCLKEIKQKLPNVQSVSINKNVSALSNIMRPQDSIVMLLNENASYNEQEIVQCAKDIGVSFVTMVTENYEIEKGKSQWVLKKLLQDMDIPHCIVHSNITMQSLLEGSLYDMICGRTISLPMKNGKLAMVHSDDVAEVVARIIRHREEHIGKIYSITGKEALTWDQVAGELSAQLDSPVRFSTLPMWAVQPSMWIKGNSPDEINKFMRKYTLYENGRAALISDTFERLMKRPPRSIQQFIKENKKSWPIRGYN